jgi:hypothetical protein
MGLLYLLVAQKCSQIVVPKDVSEVCKRVKQKKKERMGGGEGALIQ